MKRTNVILAVILFAWPFPLIARDLAMGISTGPAMGFNKDFNKSRSKTAVHLNMGLDFLYNLQCSGRFCSGLMMEGSFDWIMDANYRFGPTQITGTGIIGDFSEKISYMGGGVGFRKSFSPNRRLQPFAGMGIGFEFVKITSFKFVDALGQPLSLPMENSALNLSFMPSLGVSYALSPKWLLDFQMRMHWLVPGLMNNSYLELPVGLKYSF